jgi:hypothetical protein
MVSSAFTLFCSRWLDSFAARDIAVQNGEAYGGEEDQGDFEHLDYYRPLFAGAVASKRIIHSDALTLWF